MDVTCTIIGSFPDDYDLKVYAACEGHFTSSMKDVKQDQDDKNKYTVDITISPNAVYDSDFNGKLTVYCPYYGNTGIGQLNLTATGVGIEIKSVEKDGNDLNAIISLDGIVEKSGEKLQVKVVGGDFDPKDPWISMGGVSNPSNSKIEQTLNLNPYVIGSKEDLDKNQVRPLTSRTCTLAVVTPSGREAGYFQIDQTPIINLADQGSANCYIISAPGRYMLPARKGNGGPLWSTCPSNVSIVKTSTDDGKNTVNLEFSLLNYQKEDYIVFDVPNTIQNGNTVIALKEGNTILWSWHLWFQQSGNRADVSTTWNKYPTTEADVMNRALGATHFSGDENSTLATVVEALAASGYSVNIWDDGLYYQWGRKDPLTGTNVAEGTGSYDSSVQNPQILYKEWNAAEAGWGKGKSVNDPCPPGYRVPSTGIWREINSSADLEDIISRFPNFGYPYNLQYNAGLAVNIVYPYLNYLINGALAQAETIPFPNTNETKRRTKSQSAGSFEIKIKYAGYDYSKFGELWANNGALKYGEVGTTVTEADVFVYFNKQWYPSNPDESDDGWTVGNIKDALLSNITNRTLKYLLQIALRAVDPDEIAMNLLNSLTTKEHIPEIRNTDENPIPLSNAAHVRCVSDNSPIK